MCDKEYTKSLLLVNYQLKQSSIMNFLVANTVEVRCNFCLNWMSGQNLVKKSIHSCQDCLQKYILAGFEVFTINGDCYRLGLSRDEEQKELHAKSFIDNLDDLRSHDQEHSQKWDCLNEVIQQREERAINEEQQEVTSQNNGNSSRPKVHFELKKSNTKSQFMNQVENDFQFGKSHQSCIFNVSKVKEVREPMSGVKSLKKFNKLQDFGRSLDKTRFLQKYQFYYDNDTIKSYTNEHPKIQRQFGDDLVNIPQFNLGGNSKKSVEKSRTSRSNISSEFNAKHPKMGEEELKGRLESTLEGRYQSETLQRIMSANIKEAYEEAVVQNRTWELISYKLGDVDLQTLLSLFDFTHITTMKLINVGLSDQQMPFLVDFIAGNKIETLVLTGNKLSEVSLNLFTSRNLPHLKQLYLGKNPISKYKMKENINQLKTKFILYL